MATTLEDYFHRRAALADKLSDEGHYGPASIIATSALDALAAIWLLLDDAQRESLVREAGGTPPPATRMARFVKKFAPDDPDAHKVAVICFAEDWKRYGTSPAPAADRLLADRAGERNRMPRQELDVTRDVLLSECPEIAANPKLSALVEEYEYPAILYRFYRCPAVHLGASAKRAEGFSQGDEISYMPLYPGFTSISFGPRLATRWLRTCASTSQFSVDAAMALDTGEEGEDRLKTKWSRVFETSTGR